MCIPGEILQGRRIYDTLVSIYYLLGQEEPGEHGQPCR